MLDIVPCTLHVLTHLILQTTLRGKCCVLKPDAFLHQYIVNISAWQMAFPTSINIHMDLMAAQSFFAKLQSIMVKHMDSGVRLPGSNTISTNYIWFGTIFIKEKNAWNPRLATCMTPTSPAQ